MLSILLYLSAIAMIIASLVLSSNVNKTFREYAQVEVFNRG